jgi:ferredoxin
MRTDAGCGSARPNSIAAAMHVVNRVGPHVCDAREVSMAGKVKVRVDPDKCQGHARCKSLAPELFKLDEFGNAHEIGDGTVPEALVDKAYLAKSNCPEFAIDIIEE